MKYICDQEYYHVIANFVQKYGWLDTKYNREVKRYLLQYSNDGYISIIWCPAVYAHRGMLTLRGGGYSLTIYDNNYNIEFNENAERYIDCCNKYIDRDLELPSSIEESSKFQHAIRHLVNPDFGLTKRAL